MHKQSFEDVIHAVTSQQRLVVILPCPVWLRLAFLPAYSFVLYLELPHISCSNSSSRPFYTVHRLDKCLHSPHYVCDTAPVLNHRPVDFCWCKEHPECSPLFHHGTTVWELQAVLSSLPSCGWHIASSMSTTTVPASVYIWQKSRRRKIWAGDMLISARILPEWELMITTRCSIVCKAAEGPSELGGEHRSFCWQSYFGPCG